MARRATSVPATLRRVALFDLSITAPLAVPFVGGWTFRRLLDLGDALRLPGTTLPLDAHHLLLLNLTGLLAALWNYARLRGPTVELARLDVPARLAVAALIAGYVVFTQASPVLLLFVATELGGAVVQSRALRMERSTPGVAPRRRRARA